MTGYTDYLFLLSPPDSVKEIISKYKKASVKHIGNFKSMDSPAHLSLMHMERQKPYFADYTVSKIEPKINNMPAVVLHIEGFKYFVHLHDQYTIYAHIRVTASVAKWFDDLKKNLNIKRQLVPHVTVVRNVKKEAFEILWPHFRHKKIIEPFWVKELSIAKRETFDSFPKWQSFKTMSFKGIKLEGKRHGKNDDEQLNLF